MSSDYRTILKRRTIRRFKQIPIPLAILKKLVNAARLAPSAANLQSLEYLIVDSPEVRDKLFPYLKWANYIVPRDMPPEGKRPVAYVVVLVNQKKELLAYSAYDAGAAIENLILTAWEIGIGVCWIRALDKEKILRFLKLPKNLKLDSVLALGYCAEMPKPEILVKSIKYWKDSRGRLHVPKRRLADIMHINTVRFNG
ncbi:MAG: nitroreductase family protein [Candidatus Omnitrophica bacterium]|nr:nitroreductase family protein [Candidatus Omnitrophota bacterium]